MRKIEYFEIMPLQEAIHATVFLIKKTERRERCAKLADRLLLRSMDGKGKELLGVSLVAFGSL